MWHPLSPSPCRMLWLSSMVWGVQCVTRGPYAEPKTGQLFGSWPSPPRLPGASLYLPQGGLTAHVRGHFLNVLHMSEATSSTYCTCEGPFSERIAHVRGHFLHVSEAIVSTYCTCQRPVPERTAHVRKKTTLLPLAPAPRSLSLYPSLSLSLYIHIYLSLSVAIAASGLQGEQPLDHRTK